MKGRFSHTLCSVKKAFVLTAAAFCVFVATGVTAQAGDKVSIRFDAVIKDQAEDRKMLDMVNEFRTGSEAWQYDSNGNKKTVSGLKALKYDYILERIAYRRAKEIAVYMDHERPDGSGDDFRGAFKEDSFIHEYEIMGENLLAGEETAAAAVESFKETNYDYFGQAHRRNMLNPNYVAMGVAHIKVGDMDFWVQEFGSSYCDKYEWEPEKNKLLDVILNVDSDYLGEFYLVPNYESKKVKIGETFNYPEFKAYVKNGMSKIGFDFSIPLHGYDNKYKFTSEDPSILSFDNSYIKGEKNGKTNLVCTTTFNNKEYSYKIPVDVFSQITKLKVDSDEITMKVGDTRQLKITLEPEGADLSDLKILQMDSGKDVASMSDTGLITALKPGRAIFILGSKSNISVNEWVFVYVTDKNGKYTNNSGSNNSSSTHTSHHSTTETFYLKGAKIKRETNDDVTKVTYLQGPTMTAKVSIPGSVKRDGIKYPVNLIAANAFKKNTFVKEVTIPASVTSIGKNAFNGCKKLKKITIKNASVKIGKNAFKGVPKKCKITIVTKDKKQYSKLVKELKRQGAKKASFARKK